MKLHSRVVAWVFLVYGMAGIAIACAFFLFFGGLGAAATWEALGKGDTAEAMASGGMGLAMATAGAMVVGGLSLPNFVAGYGLLRRRAWARPLGMALAVLNLFFAPIGTLFGVYALWALITEGPDEPPRAALPAPAHAPPAIPPEPSAGLWPVLTVLLMAASAALIVGGAFSLPLLAALGGARGSMATGALLGVLGAGAVVMWARRSAERARARRARREQLVIHALAQNGGRITALRAAHLTGMTADECDELLTALARKSHLSFEIEGSAAVYRAR
ncbi:MAG: hypothetical protein IT372_37875 [Polyangiaceae bacterium]|nr:hypothetical protein [Polyangiaceae bacterium]